MTMFLLEEIRGKFRSEIKIFSSLILFGMDENQEGNKMRVENNK